MGSRWRWMAVFLLVTAWIPGGGVETCAGGEGADSLFQAAMKQVGRAPAQESLEAFNRVLKADDKYAPAHYEMAKLYMSLNTPGNRQHAEFALNEAIRLDPGNVTYQLTLGDIWWAQGFLSNAGAWYEKVAKAHPESAAAAFKAGNFCLEQFLRYADATRFEPEAEVIVKFAPFALQDRDMAIALLGRCIRLAPDFRDAYYCLGVMYVESRQPAKFVSLSEQLLNRFPGDKDALLFCGLACKITGAFQKTDAFFSQALKQMDAKEREMMESVDLLQGKDDQRQILPATLQRLKADSTRLWYDTPEMDRFWQKQDPLWITRINERRLEHYSRVAYANLRFSNPSRGVSGWQTDMGKTWIKFGRYVHRNTNPQATIETWFYESFNISFRGDGTGKWGFGGDLGGLGTFGEAASGGASIFSLGHVSQWANADQVTSEFFRTPRRPIWLPHFSPSPRDVFKETPPRYIDPYRDKKYSLPHQIVAFRDGDSVRVEVSYAIPKGRLRVSEPEGVVRLLDGIFVFDADWREVYRKPDVAVEVKWPGSGPKGSTGADSLRRSNLVSYSTVRMGQGSYHLGAEVLDQGAGSIGTFRDLRAFSFSGAALSMSDLLLASRIDTRTPTPEGWKDLKVVPNPMRTFYRFEAVSVYFEVYNLTLDGAGRTEYEISYRITRPKRIEIDPTLFADLDLPEAHARVEIEHVSSGGKDSGEGEGPADYRVRYVLPEWHRISQTLAKQGRSGSVGETSVTARYAGERKDDFTYLQIDVSQMPAGVYRLTVAVRDARTGRTAERETLFRVME